MRKRRKSIITCSSLAQSQIELPRYADADAPQRPSNQVKQLLRIYDTHFNSAGRSRTACWMSSVISFPRAADQPRCRGLKAGFGGARDRTKKSSNMN
jgi:hypothetical protein